MNVIFGVEFFYERRKCFYVWEFYGGIVGKGSVKLVGIFV